MLKVFLEKLASCIATFLLHCEFVQKKQSSIVYKEHFLFTYSCFKLLSENFYPTFQNLCLLFNGIPYRQHQIIILHYFYCYITFPQYSYSIHFHVTHNIIRSSKTWTRGKYIATYWVRSFLLIFSCLFFIRKIWDSLLCISPIYLLNSPCFTFRLSDL